MTGIDEYIDWQLEEARLAADNTAPPWFTALPADLEADHKCDVCGRLVVRPGWCARCETEPAA